MDKNQNNQGDSTQLPPGTKDLMSIEEFAEWLDVSKNTVIHWLQAGTLESGEDYLCVGRIIRLIPGTSLRTLLKKSTASQARLSTGESATKSRKQPVKHFKSGPSVNFNY